MSLGYKRLAVLLRRQSIHLTRPPTAADRAALTSSRGCAGVNPGSLTGGHRPAEMVRFAAGVHEGDEYTASTTLRVQRPPAPHTHARGGRDWSAAIKSLC
jgi:hypothetical protein